MKCRALQAKDKKDHPLCDHQQPQKPDSVMVWSYGSEISEVDLHTCNGSINAGKLSRNYKCVAEEEEGTGTGLVCLHSRWIPNEECVQNFEKGKQQPRTTPETLHHMPECLFSVVGKMAGLQQVKAPNYFSMCSRPEMQKWLILKKSNKKRKSPVFILRNGMKLKLNRRITVGLFFISF